MTVSSGGRSAGILFGGVLILLGVIFLSGQVLGDFFRVDFGQFLWPFFIILPGIVLLGVAMTAEGQVGVVLSIVGGLLSMLGLLLFFQNVTGLWASWAYAWALMAPTGPGLGLMLYGLLRNDPTRMQSGMQLATIGVCIFAAGAVFFELVLGISGFGLGRYGWPLLLIGLGVFGLVRGLLARQAHARE